MISTRLPARRTGFGSGGALISWWYASWMASGAIQSPLRHAKSPSHLLNIEDASIGVNVMHACRWLLVEAEVSSILAALATALACSLATPARFVLPSPKASRRRSKTCQYTLQILNPGSL